MRKQTVARVFWAWCGDDLIGPRLTGVWGGEKSPVAHFEFGQIEFTFDPKTGRAFKSQAKDCLVFDHPVALRDYAENLRQMQENDPLYRHNK